LKLLEKSAAITGVGQSEVARPSDRSALELTIDACVAAVEDAGLQFSDIDGLSSWPGYWDEMPGISPVRLEQVINAFGLELNWYDAGRESAGQFVAIINACAAVASGLARHVLCFRTVAEATYQTKGRRASVLGSDKTTRISDMYQWSIPFGQVSGTHFAAMWAHRHFHEYGTTREQLAQIALNARKNAALNPNAIFKQPLSLDDYMNARVISTPLVLFDCDVPIDGSTAVVVSHVDTVKDLSCKPVYFEAVGCSISGPYGLVSDDLTSFTAAASAKMLWNRTDLRPKDVDVAELYDGFSTLTMNWLETLGFCGKGESGAFVEGGGRIALDGELPLNTHGGQLSAGRQHGFGYIHEAVLQLRGDAGRRQVKPDPRVAAISVAGGPIGACALLRSA
jgi:acetyl-CoA acetyltransferase